MTFKKGGTPWNKGKTGIYSKETKRKISLSLKGRYVGRKHPFYGKHHSKEAKRKMSIALKGRKSLKKNKTYETIYGKKRAKKIRKKLSVAHLGYKGYWLGKHRSKEDRRKMSEAHKGQIPWSKGKKYLKNKYPNYGMRNKRHLEETKRKISIARKGKAMGKRNPSYGGLSKEQKRKLSIAHMGLKHTKKARKKIGLASKEHWQDAGYVKKWREGMKGSVNPPTKLEIQTMEIIKILNLPFKYVGDGRFYIERFNPDFINNSSKKIIEIYGSYWHSEIKESPKKHKRRLKAYNKHGFRTLVIRESELKKNRNKVIKKIKKFCKK